LPYRNKEELVKCDVVCANCHRIRTRRRGQRCKGNELAAQNDALQTALRDAATALKALRSIRREAWKVKEEFRGRYWHDEIEDGHVKISEEQLHKLTQALDAFDADEKAKAALATLEGLNK
jgi:hypothetical protein